MPDVEEAVAAWVQNTVGLLDAEAREEEARVAETAAKGKAYKGKVAEVELTIAGSVVVTIEGRPVGPKACDVVPRGVPVLLQFSETESYRGVSCAVRETSLLVSIDADEERETRLQESMVTVVPLRTDVTTKAMKAALKGSGLGFGSLESDTPPLTRWRARSTEQQRLVSLAFDDQLGALPLASDAAAEDQRHVELFAALNPSQEEAVRCCQATPHPVHLILGPPGTGKTETVCEVIRQAVLRAQRVLVATPSNVAADNIVERLCIRGPSVKKLRCVRIGHSGRLADRLQPFSFDARMLASDAAKVSQAARADLRKLRQKMQASKDKSKRSGMWAEVRALTRDIRDQERKKAPEVLGQANVVVGTLVNTTQYAVRQQRFDVVIIDEACQALEAAAWVAASKADRVVLAGDPFQLPPTVLSNNDTLKLTLFERLYRQHGGSLCTLLNTQYRMHEVISNWSSGEFYEGKVEPHDTVREHLLCDLEGVEDTEETSSPAVLVDTSHAALDEEDEQGSKRNAGEAQLAVDYVSRLADAGVAHSQIAVITPYSAQVALLVELLPPEVEVGTVDSYQGREKEAVVLSLVRSNGRGEIGFLADYRRLNVAITRARRHVAVVCNCICLRHDAFLKRMIDYFEEQALVQLPE